MIGLSVHSKYLDQINGMDSGEWTKSVQLKVVERPKIGLLLWKVQQIQ